MAKDDVLVINHHQANLQVKDRVNSKGAVTGQRTVISIESHSEPVTVMLDEGLVAQKSAEYLARTIREQTQAIADTVKPSTADARRVAERAFAAGKPWAVKRYSGGRTGTTPPEVGALRMFNHSGRLARGIVARYQKQAQEWKINYPANRWNVADFRSQAHMMAAFEKWVDRVAILKQPSSDLGLRREMEQTFKEVVQKQQMDTGFKVAEARGKQALQAFQRAADAVTSGSSKRDDREDEAA
jgi:hypothetical protein